MQLFIQRRCKSHASRAANTLSSNRSRKTPLSNDAKRHDLAEREVTSGSLARYQAEVIGRFPEMKMSLSSDSPRRTRVARLGAGRRFAGTGAQVHLLVQSLTVASPGHSPREDAHASSRHRVPVWTSADSPETYLGCFLRDWLPHLVNERANVRERRSRSYGPKCRASNRGKTRIRLVPYPFGGRGYTRRVCVAPTSRRGKTLPYTARLLLSPMSQERARFARRE